KPGIYSFTVTADRAAGPTRDIQTGLAYLVVGYEKVGPTAVDDSGYFTSGLPITIPVLANDIPDPNIPDKPLFVTAIQDVAVRAGSTVSLTNASVTLNADGTLTYTPSANLVPSADQFKYTITDVNNRSSEALVTVTLGQFPRVTVDPHGIVACSMPVTLTATGAGGFPPYTYTWTDSTNSVVRTSSPTNGTDSLIV